jgi:hypothetical protein
MIDVYAAVSARRSRRAANEKVGGQQTGVGKWFNSLLGHILLCSDLLFLVSPLIRADELQVSDMGVQFPLRDTSPNRPNGP